MTKKTLGLFQGYGVELEYMIVSRQDLSVLPIADQVLAKIAGRHVDEVKRGKLRWSNELVLHVIELKTNGPATSLEGLAEEFYRQACNLNQMLEDFDGRLMPGAMHPWLNPETDCHLWPHGNRSIYQSYDRIFGCRGHGWSNLQSAHLNLPFADDDQFGRLHAAIRIVLPLIPGLSAASPIFNGRLTGLLDNRLEVYRLNQSKIPSITGQVIPEAVFTKDAYQKTILEKMYQDISPHDIEGLLQQEWLNSRGAIARFERNTIEIRLLDVQECPSADFSILELLVATLKTLVLESQAGFSEQVSWHENWLADLFLKVLREGQSAVIDEPRFLAMFGLKQQSFTVGNFWQEVASKLVPQSHSSTWQWLNTLFEEGPLAQRLVKAVGTKPNRRRLAEVYRELCDCLKENRLFHA